MNVKIKFVLFNFILFVSYACKNTDSKPSTVEELANKVTIFRDIYGIPHIKGETDESLLFGLAYAQAEDHFDRIEKQIIRSIGRLAEVEGESGKANDMRVKAFEIERISKEEYHALEPQIKKLFDGFAAGLNYYLNQNPDVKPQLITHFKPWYFIADHKGNAFGTLGQVRINDDMIVKYLEDDVKGIGSNAFVVGKGKSKSKNAILVSNPHMDYEDPYEFQLTSAEGLNFYGAVRKGGTIFPVVGHNQHLGWTWTTNNPDVADAYEIQFDSKDSSMYKYGAQYIEVEAYQDTIKIKTDSGIFYQNVNFRKTIHGPILAESESGKPISIKLASLQKGGMLEQLYRMALSHDLESFKKALELNALYAHNISYADDQGNIMYLYNGLIPKRDTSFNWQLPVDGSLTETEWQGFHTIEELPQLLNPACQYIQNCNNRPFETTTKENPDPANFPDYMTYYQRNSNRGRRAKTLLDTLDNATINSLEAAIFDRYVESAQEDIEAIKREAYLIEKLDPKRIDNIREPLQMLVSWDRYSSSTSAATSIYYIWKFKSFHLKRIKTENHNIVALEQTIEKLKAEKGSWKVAWGDIYRHQRSLQPLQYDFDKEKTSHPIDGGISLTGIMFASAGHFEGHLPDVGLKGLSIRAQGGDSYVSIVEFGEEVKAKSITPYGASDHPESEHYDDQAELYAQGKLKPVFFTEEEILANLKVKYNPGEIKWR
ncbi:penicillin acylase family protein [Marivirga sp. S37H4]|uniref:Penicillin acylase family protein n=1 Tax=Marivirga aurantiaca TaxID=2802615 RepID=A0A934WY68_9BACT|nr:penicillin acylase family protein [Marivirga aurantiaca]MBK6265353.1 penicillin acylase family protein [Marivirga aurantiaca]